MRTTCIPLRCPAYLLEKVDVAAYELNTTRIGFIVESVRVFSAVLRARGNYAIPLDITDDDDYASAKERIRESFDKEDLRTIPAIQQD